MPFHQNGEVRFFTFDLLAEAGFNHAVFTRHGGVSLPPWDTLNVGSTVGDDPQHVAENRQRTFAAVGRDLTSLYDVWQVHSAEVICTAKPRPPERAHLKADAILTDKKGISLFMRFADCVPIFLLDPQRRVVGLVHAGWQGTVKKVAGAAIAAMQTAYGCAPGDILAGIGPSICVEHYPVGEEVAAKVRQAFGEDAGAVLRYRDNGPFLDLWQANQIILQQAGVKRIEAAGLCTCCHLADWYSHRGENGRTGRFGAMIALED
jgi:YfiH family protein